MHVYFHGWVVLDWTMATFLIRLAIAVVFLAIGWYFKRLYRLMPLGILAVSYVLYQGIHWPYLWDWVAWLFWAGMLVLLVMALVYLFVGYRWNVGRITFWVAAFVSGLLAIIMAVNCIFGLWNHAFPGHRIGGEASVTAPAETNPNGSPGSSQPPIGTADCEHDTWAVTTTMPSSAPWSTQVLVGQASTSLQAYQAFQDWYSNTAMDNTALYHQLAVAVGANTPPEADMVDNGYASPEMSCLSASMQKLFDEAVYYPHHTYIRVKLQDGTEIRLMRASGQVQ